MLKLKGRVIEPFCHYSGLLMRMSGMQTIIREAFLMEMCPYVTTLRPILLPLSPKKGGRGKRLNDWPLAFL
jgi:hypothetical protein